MLHATRWRSLPTMGATLGGTLRLPRTESRLLFRTQLNLLLEGPESTIDAALLTLRPHLRRPVTTWCGDLSVRMPPEPNGTLVLRDVSRLGHDQQQQLLDWLNVTVGPVQVISTTSEPLFALVERGTFLDALYYRLNVVRVDLH